MDANPSPGPTTRTPTPTPTTSASAAANVVVVFPPPPPFPAAPRSVDLSALEFIVGLIAVISIPALIYTFFFYIKCPRRAARAAPRAAAEDLELSAPARAPPAAPAPAPSQPPAPSEEKYSKEVHGDECTVCLSAFDDGDEVKRLSACGHAFHVVCVDQWLSSHQSCPICRATVPGIKPGGGGGAAAGDANTRNHSSIRNHRRSTRTREDDFHQGLPDASNLV